MTRKTTCLSMKRLRRSAFLEPYLVRYPFTTATLLLPSAYIIYSYSGTWVILLFRLCTLMIGLSLLFGVLANTKK